MGNVELLCICRIIMYMYIYFYNKYDKFLLSPNYNIEFYILYNFISSHQCTFDMRWNWCYIYQWMIPSLRNFYLNSFFYTSVKKWPNIKFKNRGTPTRFTFYEFFIIWLLDREYGIMKTSENLWLVMSAHFEKKGVNRFLEIKYR